MENRTETRMDMVPFVFNDNMVRGCLDDRASRGLWPGTCAGCWNWKNIGMQLLVWTRMKGGRC